MQLLYAWRVLRQTGDGAPRESSLVLGVSDARDAQLVMVLNARLREFGLDLVPLPLEHVDDLDAAA